jgi:isopentenyldiphosphate isomerase
MADALIQIVDEQDRPVRAATKQEAWDEGLIHRIVRIMATAPDGRVLLQKRSQTMDLYPGCWDHSASGHVDAGEDYDTAACRETAEELGIAADKLETIGSYESHGVFAGRKLHRFNRVYRLALDPATPIWAQDSEVAGVRWYAVGDIKRLIKESPHEVTDGLRQVIERYY